jgi:hypothetical protein
MEKKNKEQSNKMSTMSLKCSMFVMVNVNSIQYIKQFILNKYLQSIHSLRSFRWWLTNL